MNKKLILISGSPCVGKTAVGMRLFESYNTNSVEFTGIEMIAKSAC